jgi:hypothetical protein
LWILNYKKLWMWYDDLFLLMKKEVPFLVFNDTYISVFLVGSVLLISCFLIKVFDRNARIHRKVYLVSINVREYRRGNQIRTIQRNWQHTVNKTRVKTKQKHNTCERRVSRITWYSQSYNIGKPNNLSNKSLRNYFIQ